MTEIRKEILQDSEQTVDDLLHWAWTIICNVSQGNWEQQPEEWVNAAEKFRDAYHVHLDAGRARRNSEARELLRQVLMDFANKTQQLDCPSDCQCSASRARRFLDA